MGADPAELFQLQMFLMPVMIVMTMMVVMLLLTYQTFPRCVWAAFKKELDDMPIRDVINIPHKYLKLYLWKYPVRSQDITRRTQRYNKKPKLQCV